MAILYPPKLQLGPCQPCSWVVSRIFLVISRKSPRKSLVISRKSLGISSNLSVISRAVPRYGSFYTGTMACMCRSSLCSSLVSNSIMTALCIKTQQRALLQEQRYVDRLVQGRFDYIYITMKVYICSVLILFLWSMWVTKRSGEKHP